MRKIREGDFVTDGAEFKGFVIGDRKQGAEIHVKQFRGPYHWINQAEFEPAGEDVWTIDPR